VARVYSLSHLRAAIDVLGWTDVSHSELAEWAEKNDVDKGGLVAYLAALAASPTAGMDDQAIEGCDPKEADKITEHLRGRKVVL
jgi:hypothetical protein